MVEEGRCYGLHQSCQRQPTHCRGAAAVHLKAKTVDCCSETLDSGRSPKSPRPTVPHQTSWVSLSWTLSLSRRWVPALPCSSSVCSTAARTVPPLARWRTGRARRCPGCRRPSMTMSTDQLLMSTAAAMTTRLRTSLLAVSQPPHRSSDPTSPNRRCCSSSLLDVSCPPPLMLSSARLRQSPFDPAPVGRTRMRGAARLRWGCRAFGGCP